MEITTLRDQNGTVKAFLLLIFHMLNTHQTALQTGMQEINQ